MFDRNNIAVHTVQVVTVSTPHMDKYNNQFDMVVDVAVLDAGKTQTYTFKDSNEVGYTGQLMITPNKECVIKELQLLKSHDQVSKMYYEKDGSKYTGPFLNKNLVLNKYKEIRGVIPEYNEWDYYVTVQMIYSDNYNLIHEWFPNISEDEFNQKIYQLATNWLNDKDNPFGNSKTWCYFN